MTNVVLILVMILAMIPGFLFTMSLVGLITRPRDKKHRVIAGKNRKRDHRKNAEGNHDDSAGRHDSDI